MSHTSVVLQQLSSLQHFVLCCVNQFLSSDHFQQRVQEGCVLKLEKNNILILQPTNAQVLKFDGLQFSISFDTQLQYFCSQFAAWIVLLCHPWDTPERGLLCQIQDCSSIMCFQQVLPWKVTLQITQLCWTHNTSAAMATSTRSTSWKLHKRLE